MLILFAVSLFVSALLLFLVQPMFSKMVLPRLGGTPAVWITCMVFYQAVLLAGYVYAHLSARWLGVRGQAAAHVALLLGVFLVLPISITQGWVPPPAAHPAAWLLMLLLVSAGLPFFVISITAPMLQKWFSHTGHPAAKDPYFLYAASNLGSMAALLGYPVVVEPFLPLARQSWIWSLGYGLLALLIVACGLVLWLSPESRTTAASAPARANPEDASEVSQAPTVNRRVWWVLWSCAPSSLLLGITTYITTDIAAVPLLWVIPLALYLLTFVIVFSRRPWLSHRLMVAVQPYAVLLVAVLFLWGLQVESVSIIFFHLLAFFVTALVCHGELAQSRPAAAYLTEYYLWIAVGGVLGGIFNAIIAPLIFTSLAEYPLVLVLACLLRPRLNGAPAPKARWLDFILPALLGAALVAVVYDQEGSGGKITTPMLIASCAAVMACFAFARRPVRFGLGVAAMMLAGMLYYTGQYKVLHAERSFFGTLQVLVDSGGHYHNFYHGTTLHGAQSTDPQRHREPLTYYLTTGPIGQVFYTLRAQAASVPRHVAIVGLGAGSLSCYAVRGDRWDFYEIDPAVERIARNPKYFTYYRDCRAHKRIILGDARLSMIQAPEHYYGIIVFDAFSSDAVPIHLVNREALRLYLEKLADGGLLVFHISNRYLDLKPVLGNLAQDANLVALVQNRELSDEEENAYYVRTTWVVMARKAEDLGDLMHNDAWEVLPARPGARLWTDDFSNIAGVILWPSFDAPRKLWEKVSSWRATSPEIPPKTD